MIRWLGWLVGGCSSPVVETAPATPPTLASPDHVRFVAIGDAGKGVAGAERVAAGAAAACARLGCDLVVLLGDNLYPRGMESPHDPRAEAWIAARYAAIGAPVYAVLGNHDYAGGRDRERADWQIAWANGRAGVELPANAWVFDAGPARFVGLDTNAAFQFGPSFQAGWLHEQLAGAIEPWRVVLGHHPFRSNGPHGNAGTYDDTRFIPAVSGFGLRDLFEQELCGAADLYLSGHDHSRQVLEACGVHLVVSGAGATTTRIVDRANQARFERASLGAVWIELGPTAGRILPIDDDGNVEIELPIAPGSR